MVQFFKKNTNTEQNAFLLDLIEKGKNKSFTFGADEKKLFRLETREAGFPLFSINDIKEDTEHKEKAEDTEKEKQVFNDLKINVNIKKIVSFQFIKYIVKPLTIEDYTKIIKNKKILLFYLNIKELKIDNINGVFIFEKELQEKNILPLYKTIETENKKNICINFGIDENGEKIPVNLEKLPHLLVAGTTGSGKSVFLNSLILSLIYNYNTDDLRLCLIDPKTTEFELFQGLPHLLYNVINNFDDVILLLDEIITEMYKRYKILKKYNCKNIIEYNEKNKNNKMYKIIVIIDEMADLMTQDKKTIEKKLCQLAQLSRACGIHLIIATQRPSTDVITGLIKANFPSRLCFKVASVYDSKTILDRKGAEQLQGNGDALFQSVEMLEPVRIQTPFISTKKILEVLKND